MGKKRGKYRPETARLRSWDYGWNGVYFVTICTHKRQYFFGEIVFPEADDFSTTPEIQNFVSHRSDKNIMQLSEIGKIAKSCWMEIPEHFPFVKLGEFVIMPNHVHGIVIIDKENDARNNVDTQNLVYLRRERQNSLNKFGPQSRNLASIIRGFKIGVTKGARKIDSTFRWQPKFYDHIIRDRKSFERISNYIKDNPENWMKDENYGS